MQNQKNDRKIDRYAPKKQIKNDETPENPTLVHIENLGKIHVTESLKNDMVGPKTVAEINHLSPTYRKNNYVESISRILNQL